MIKAAPISGPQKEARMSVARTICQSGLCIGCGYCASLGGGGMGLSRAGFLEPGPEAFTLSPQAEARVRAACPGLAGDMVVPAPLTNSCPAGAVDDRLWGRSFSVATAWATDPATRHAGASGGVLTALARWLIESGRVKSVLVTSYDPGYPIGTRSASSSDPGTILAAAGSKYAPAAPLAALARLRENPGPHAVIARPCDIATLRRALAAGDRLDVPLLLSFFCAGTPSDAGNRALLREMKAGEPEDVLRFRHRGNGWPGETRAELADGSTRSCSYAESWGRVLRRHVHSLCKVCPDGIGEAADLVAADAWYGDAKGYPLFAEAEGRSLLLTRTAAGQALYTEAVAAGVLQASPLDIREIDRMQPGQIDRRRQLAMRVLAFRTMGHALPRYNAAALAGYQRDLPLNGRLWGYAATLRRLLAQRLRGWGAGA